MGRNLDENCSVMEGHTGILLGPEPPNSLSRFVQTFFGHIIDLE